MISRRHNADENCAAGCAGKWLARHGWPKKTRIIDGKPAATNGKGGLFIVRLGDEWLLACTSGFELMRVPTHRIAYDIGEAIVDKAAWAVAPSMPFDAAGALAEAAYTSLRRELDELTERSDRMQKFCRDTLDPFRVGLDMAVPAETLRCPDGPGMIAKVVAAYSQIPTVEKP